MFATSNFLFDDNNSAVIPGAPTIGTATSTGTTTATVAYTAPAYNGGSTITSYTAVSSPGGITGSVSQAGSGTINISGLTPATSYTFTVYATNGVGNSASSAASNSITTSRVAVTVTISSNTQNYTANVSKVSGYVAGKTDVTFVINGGVIIGSASTGASAFTVDTSWNASDTVTVTNGGTIIGAGGAAGVWWFCLVGAAAKAVG